MDNQNEQDEQLNLPIQNEEERGPLAKNITSEDSIEVTEENEEIGPNDDIGPQEEKKDLEQEEQKNWKQLTGLNEDTLCGLLSAILFMSDRPIPLGTLRDKVDKSIPLEVLYESLEKLKQHYESPINGFRLAEIANGYQFRTKSFHSSYLKKIFKVQTLQLGPTALEVLAILAYRQPIGKHEIDEIRGVDSSHILRNLMDKKLVKVISRSDDMGKTALYGTTLEFLEFFNMNDLNDLPAHHELESLLSESEVGTDQDFIIQALPDQSSDDTQKELEELNELKEQIKNIPSSTQLTKAIAEEQKLAKSQNAAPKSSFEILEDQVLQKEIIQENELAAQSAYPVILDFDPGDKRIETYQLEAVDLTEEEEEEEEAEHLEEVEEEIIEEVEVSLSQKDDVDPIIVPESIGDDSSNELP